MGHGYDDMNEKHYHHQAVDGLFNLFTKANHDLSMLHNKLDKEFKQIYPDNVIFLENPPTPFCFLVQF